MGHGDEIAIVDANYPADSSGPRLVRLDGEQAPRVLDAVLSVLPLDEFVPDPALRMEVVGNPKRIEPVMKEFARLLAHLSGFDFHRLTGSNRIDTRCM